MITNRAGLAEIIGCALGTIDGYVRDGMPANKNGREWQFDTAQCIRWFRDRDRVSTPASDLADAELRERKARAALKELELGERARQLVHIDDLVILMDEQFSIIKSVLDQLPARIAHPVSAQSDPAKCREIVRNQIHGAYAAMNAEALTARLNHGE